MVVIINKKNNVLNMGTSVVKWSSVEIQGQVWSSMKSALTKNYHKVVVLEDTSKGRQLIRFGRGINTQG